MDVVVKIEDVWKEYRFGVFGHGTLQKDLQSWWARLRGREDPNAPVGASRGDGRKGPQTGGRFWALSGICLEIERGDVLGVIGRNGSGKSTLLKLLSRVTAPTRGTIKIRGRIASLLEVGTGFHPELTGAENIFLNGTIHGMSRAQIKKKFDQIVEFAEIEAFADTPVKRYSSGMYVRLAFSVAAHLEPEILVVDEVLAVGDLLFQKKCLGKMHDVAARGRTVIFVSHNMAVINSLCNRTAWLHEGRIVGSGPTREVTADYINQNAVHRGELAWQKGIANTPDETVLLHAVAVRNQNGAVSNCIPSGEPFSVELHYRVVDTVKNCRIGFLLTSMEGTIVFEAYDNDTDPSLFVRAPGRYCSRAEIPANILSPGRYLLSINMGIPNVRNIFSLEGALFIDFEKTQILGSIDQNVDRRGIIRPSLRWTTRKEAHATR